jgi:chemotaxis protein methyltransferase CheR
MENGTCVEFLQWCLPKLRYQWKGFRKVRNQVCKRINRRLAELDLPNLRAYRGYLKSNSEEWENLDSLCYITISRFYRDRGVFEELRSGVLPLLAGRIFKHKRKELLCWSAGCCSGEEPYTLQILWNLAVLPDLKDKLSLRIVATDRSPLLLERAERALYPGAGLKYLPKEMVQQAFEMRDDGYSLKNIYKAGVEFIEQDIRYKLPEGKFDLILCRNLVFTYFREDLQSRILREIAGKLNPDGFLIIGAHESLPSGEETLSPYGRSKCIFQKVSQ